MFSSCQIPLIGPTAGPGNDGVVVGSIAQSAPTAVLLGESLITLAQVLRKDITVEPAAVTVTSPEIHNHLPETQEITASTTKYVMGDKR